MEKLQFKNILYNITKKLESSTIKILEDAGSLSENCKRKIEISDLESEIKEDFSEIGILSYELFKMGKDINMSQFERKFMAIEEKKKRLKNLSRFESLDEYKNLHEFEGYREKTSFHNNYDLEEDIFQDDSDFLDYEEDKEDEYSLVKCGNCGYENPEYVAYCSRCGKKL